MQPNIERVDKAMNFKTLWLKIKKWFQGDKDEFLFPVNSFVPSYTFKCGTRFVYEVNKQRTRFKSPFEHLPGIPTALTVYVRDEDAVSRFVSEIRGHYSRLLRWPDLWDEWIERNGSEDYIKVYGRWIGISLTPQLRYIPLNFYEDGSVSICESITEITFQR